MKVVFDTNILVSALFWRGAPYRCLSAVEAGLAELIISPPILDELRNVLMTKFEHTRAEADDAASLVSGVAQLVEIVGELHVVAKDPDDDKFVETACVGGAPYIVSGDHHLLVLGTYAGISVISARAFLDILSRPPER